MSIEALVHISRYYGNNPDYVLAGGGNTSWKDKDTFYVKGSGLFLAEATVDSFVRIDRKALAMIWKKPYPESGSERESTVLVDLLAARTNGGEQKRPSVETLLHDIIPSTFVVHLHPALVNGLTCSQQGEQFVKEIFDNDAIWIPSTNPGYTLAILVKNALDAYYNKYCKSASIIFLQNHGIFVGADNIDSIKSIYSEIMTKIGTKIKRNPDFSDERREQITDGAIARILTNLSKGPVAFMYSTEIAKLITDRIAFTSVSSAFTPDHIVYAGSAPLFTEAQTDEGISTAWKNHVTGNPKIIVIQDIGIFGTAKTQKAANLALDLFKDAVKIAIYSESFGGPLFMTQDKIDFINNWEAERFRSGISTKKRGG
jgi:rhamnose utilization protein RhaD (predicted bifunctional aldolase and dehydrogenase)